MKLLSIIILTMLFAGNISAKRTVSGNTSLKISTSDTDTTKQIYSKPENADEFITIYEDYCAKLLAYARQETAGGNRLSVNVFSQFKDQGSYIEKYAQEFVPYFTEEQLQRWTEITNQFSREASVLSANTNSGNNEETAEQTDIDTTTLEGLADGDEDSLADTDIAQIPKSNYGCDKVLDEWEKLMNQFIPVYRKMMKDNQDQNSAEEMNTLSIKMQELAGEIADCAANFSPDEIKRLQDIAERITKAFQEMNE